MTWRLMLLHASLFSFAPQIWLTKSSLLPFCNSDASREEKSFNFKMEKSANGPQVLRIFPPLKDESHLILNPSLTGQNILSQHRLKCACKSEKRTSRLLQKNEHVLESKIDFAAQLLTSLTSTCYIHTKASLRDGNVSLWLAISCKIDKRGIKTSRCFFRDTAMWWRRRCVQLQGSKFSPVGGINGASGAGRECCGWRRCQPELSDGLQLRAVWWNMYDFNSAAEK